MYTHQEPGSTEVSDAAEAISPLVCTPSITDEDPTLQMDQEPAGKMEQMKKALPYDTHLMQSNLKVHFECEVFKEDGECLKESLVVRFWCVCGLHVTEAACCHCRCQYWTEVEIPLRRRRLLSSPTAWSTSVASQAKTCKGKLKSHGPHVCFYYV